MAWFFRRIPKYSIGIDFGTTTTRLSYYDNTKEINVPPTVKPIRSLAQPMPTGFNEPKYDWKVGEDEVDSSSGYYALFKLKVGTMQELKPNRGNLDNNNQINVRPELLAAEVMNRLYQNVVGEKRELENIKDVTITVPAEWSAIQRQATIMAGRIAGFSNISLIEEPVAAYLGIVASNQTDTLMEARNILVFDYGGGTLDITVIHRPIDGLPYIIGRSMDAGNLAGEAIDEKLAREVVGNTNWEMMVSDSKSRLVTCIRQMKEQLNPEPPKPIMGAMPWAEQVVFILSEEKADNKGKKRRKERKLIYKKNELVLQKSVLEKVWRSISLDVVKNIEAAINNVRLPEKNKTFTKNDIDVVLLVGGSSYLRMVQEEIGDFFDGKQLNKEILLENPERVVAMGAALYKSYLDRNLKRFDLHVPMHTYLKYVDEKKKPAELSLDDYNDGRLPLSPYPPLTCPIPSDLENIDWKVVQKHVYGRRKEEVIESVKFNNISEKADRLRLKYKINSNGILEVWKPELIYKQKIVVKTGHSRYYDWTDKVPEDLALEYGIRT